MADRGRDLKIAVISDTDKFDTSDAAKDLEKLGKEALDAGKDLDNASKDLESFGKDAETTARKVDSAFEKIAASSKSNLRKVDDDTDKAKKGLDDFSEEANQSGKEAAASFSGGFDSVTDLIQETAANAFAGFGPIGAAAGLAAAAGIGFFVNKINEGKERVEALTQSFLQLRKEGIDPATDAISHMVDEMDNAELSQWKDDADKLGLSYGVLRDAFDGNAGAIATVREAQARYNKEHGATINGAKIAVDRFGGLTQKLKETETAYKNSGDAAEFAGKQTDEATDAVSAYNAVSQDAIDKAQELVAAHDATTDAVKNVASADDEVTAKISENGQVKISAITKVLKEQTKAAQAFTKNLQAVQAQGDDEFTAWIASKGPEMAQAWVSASANEKKTLYNAWKTNVGAQMGAGTAAGLTGSQTTVRDAAGNLYTVAKDELTGQPIVIPVHAALVTRGPGSVAAAEEAARRAVKPVVIPVMLQTAFAGNPKLRVNP